MGLGNIRTSTTIGAYLQSELHEGNPLTERKYVIHKK